MIKAKFYFKNKRIVSFEIKGHANLSSYGTDIVCSAVSSTCLMTVNGLLENGFDNLDYKISEGYTSVKIGEMDTKLDILLNSFYSFMEELARQYPKNLSLRIMEV